MNPSPTDTGRPPLEIRGARASSVIVQRIPAEAAAIFMEWQHGVTASAAEFPGYQATEVYPPPPGGGQEWVAVVHFDDSKSLQGWLDSAKRAEWLAKLPREIRDFHLQTLPSGFGAWFAGQSAEGGLPPHWKIALSVLLGLYPTVMLLTLFLSPHTQRFGLAVSMLIGNAASVAFLEWLGGPAINPLLGPWLRANGKEHRARSCVGTILILGALGVMTLLFYLVT